MVWPLLVYRIVWEYSHEAQILLLVMFGVCVDFVGAGSHHE
jgi:hypothetical protein